MIPSRIPHTGAFLLLGGLQDDDDVMLMIRSRPGMSWFRLMTYGLWNSMRTANDNGRNGT